jgi:Uma2 family endonuclease
LLHGRFYVSPSPSPLHQIVQFLLWEVLMREARKSGAVVLGAPMDTVLADHSVVQPDLLYISAERRHIVRERVEGAPDLVVEVLSSQTARRDRVEKLKLYAESGVKEYWIVDPVGRQIDFLVCRDGEFRVVLARDGWYQSEVLPEIRLDLVGLWREVDLRLP